ncbi:MAG: LacI family DNA-binding transcriptional regulator [Chthoniobacteraceae bacterium]
MRKVTMLDIARRAGVSKNTVSLALRNDPQIPPVTREKVKALAAELGYTKNPTVAHLMAELRAGSPLGYQATLALLNANEDPHAFTAHRTIPTYVAGCRRRAEQSGYRFDEFWLHDPELDGEKLNKVLRARSIRGVVVVGLMNPDRLPERFLPTWEDFPCVVTGVRTRNPALSFACVDHHITAMRAVDNALRLGYRRPGLVLDSVIDRLVEGRFSAGFHAAQAQLPTARRLRPFYFEAEAKNNPELFQKWLGKENPDVIVTLYHVVHRWLRDLGMEAPRDLGLIQLEWRPDHAQWAGMNQHNDVVGEAAVEMVIGMIHNNEHGIPAFPRATLIGSTWVDGETVKSITG